MKLEFFGLVFEKKNLKYEILFKKKICSVVGESFHAEGRTDTHYDANSRYSQFCERAKSDYFYWAKRVSCKLRVSQYIIRQAIQIDVGVLYTSRCYELRQSQKHSQTAKIELSFPDPNSSPMQSESNSEKFKYYH